MHKFRNQSKLRESEEFRERPILQKRKLADTHIN
jgi:hypothetical protein